MKSISEIRRDNLAHAMKEKGISQTELARKMGLATPSIVNQHVRGVKNIGEKLARKYEIYIPLPAFDLDREQGLTAIAAQVPGQATRVRRPIDWDPEAKLGHEFVLIPPLSVRVRDHDRTVIWQVNEAGEKHAFRQSWLTALGLQPGRLAFWVAQDSAMRPRIESGDLLVIDIHDITLASGKIFALAIADEFFVRRAFKDPDGGIRLAADSTDKIAFPDLVVNPAQLQALQVIGRVAVIVSGTL